MAPFIASDVAEELQDSVSDNDSEGGDGSSDEGSHAPEDENDNSAILGLDPILLMKLAQGSQSIEETEKVIDHIGRVEINIGDGLTLLHQAASNNRVELVEFLCSKGHPTEPKTVAGETPLDQAAWRGAQDAAILLIKYGADVDCQTHLGYTPLHRAAYYDHPMLASLLRVAGADLLIKDSNGETAYDVAVNQENEEIQYTLQPEVDADGNDVTNQLTVHNPKHPNYKPEARVALFEAYAMFSAGGADDEDSEEEEEEAAEDSGDDNDESYGGAETKTEANSEVDESATKRQRR